MQVLLKNDISVTCGGYFSSNKKVVNLVKYSFGLVECNSIVYIYYKISNYIMIEYFATVLQLL